MGGPRRKKMNKPSGDFYHFRHKIENRTKKHTKKVKNSPKNRKTKKLSI